MNLSEAVLAISEKSWKIGTFSQYATLLFWSSDPVWLYALLTCSRKWLVIHDAQGRKFFCLTPEAGSKPNPDWSAWKFIANRDHFVHAPSQREMVLQCNLVSHWLCNIMIWKKCASLALYEGNPTVTGRTKASNVERWNLLACTSRWINRQVIGDALALKWRHRNGDRGLVLLRCEHVVANLSTNDSTAFKWQLNCWCRQTWSNDNKFYDAIWFQ